MSESYLVVSNTKKGIREFKFDGYVGSYARASWTRYIARAHRFSLSELPSLIAYVSTRRCVTVCLVNGNEFTVLGLDGRYQIH